MKTFGKKYSWSPSHGHDVVGYQVYEQTLANSADSTVTHYLPLDIVFIFSLADLTNHFGQVTHHLLMLNSFCGVAYVTCQLL